MQLWSLCVSLLEPPPPACLGVRRSGIYVMIEIFIMLWLELLAILAEGAIALSVTHSCCCETPCIALHPCISITWSMKRCPQHKSYAEIRLLVLI